MATMPVRIAPAPLQPAMDLVDLGIPTREVHAAIKAALRAWWPWLRVAVTVAPLLWGAFAHRLAPPTTHVADVRPARSGL